MTAISDPSPQKHLTWRKKRRHIPVTAEHVTIGSVHLLSFAFSKYLDELLLGLQARIAENLL